MIETQDLNLEYETPLHLELRAAVECTPGLSEVGVDFRLAPKADALFRHLQSVDSASVMVIQYSRILVAPEETTFSPSSLNRWLGEVATNYKERSGVAIEKYGRVDNTYVDCRSGRAFLSPGRLWVSERMGMLSLRIEGELDFDGQKPDYLKRISEVDLLRNTSLMVYPSKEAAKNALASGREGLIVTDRATRKMLKREARQIRRSK